MKKIRIELTDENIMLMSKEKVSFTKFINNTISYILRIEDAPEEDLNEFKTKIKTHLVYNSKERKNI